jgi:hypothetical protein
VNSKIYTSSDLDTLASWWSDNDSVTPHESQLSTLGVIGYVDDVPVAAVWAYMSVGVPVAFLEHFITNPDVKSTSTKLRGVTHMMDRILDELSEDGYQLIRATTWSKTLGKVCARKWGFEVVDNESTNLSLLIK